MSMFDDDDFFSDDSEESEEADVEDVMLAEMGIQCKYKDIYLKHNKGKKIFNGAVKPEKLTQGFFKYYLENCDQAMIDVINTDKLTQKLNDMIPKKALVSEDFGKEDDGVKNYEELANGRLILNNQLKQENNQLKQEQKKIAGNMIWLYEFMESNMRMKEDVDISENDIKILEGITEAIGK